MAYHFAQSDNSVQSGVRRIAREQAKGALSDLADMSRAEAQVIHALRRRVKKLRGLLRLVRPSFRGFAAENAALRDAARGIAPLRDAGVMLVTLDRLCALGEVPGAEALRETLAARIGAARDAAAAEARLAAFRLAMKGLAARAPGWKISGKGFAALEEGLEATWRDARRSMKAARAEAAGGFDAAPFHDWRKHLKNHWYHARLLAPIWPATMEPHTAAAGDLGELLGDHNDLDIFLHGLDGVEVAPDTRAALAGLALARRRELAAQSLSLGARLLAGSPGELSGRWSVWWEAWRAEPQARPESEATKPK